MVLAAVIDIATEIVPYFDDYVPRWALVAVISAGILARLIPQAGLNK